MSGQKVRDVSDVVGEWGLWHKNITFFCVSISLFSAFNNLAVAFYAPNISYLCNDSLNRSSLVRSNESENIDHCRDDCHDWEFDRSVFRSTIVDEWGLVCQRNGLASTTQSVYMIGYVFGALVFGYVSDRFGRLPTIWITVIIEIIAGISSAVSLNITHFMISRFVLGLASNGRLLSTFMLVNECVGPELRASLGMCVQMGWAFGYCLLPIIAYFAPNFRHLLLITSLSEILWLFWLWRIPESVRWQITHNKIDQAYRQMRRAVKMNNLPFEDFDEHFEKLKGNVEQEEQKSARKRKTTVFDLMRSASLRRSTLILYFTWFVNSFVYYGISLNISDFGGNLFINFFIAGIIEFPSYLFPILAFKYVGRRPLTAGLMYGSSLSCFAVVPFLDSSHVWLRVTIAMVGKFFVTSSYGLIYVYAAEIYPTVVRQTGVGSCSVAARLGSIIAPFVKDLGIYTGMGIVLSVFGTLSVVDGILVMFLPETQGKHIPDTLEEAELLYSKTIIATDSQPNRQ